MDRYEAIYNFWSSFGIPAYEENAVPDAEEVSFPYITYSTMSATFGGDVGANASLWTRSSSWEQADAISDMIEQRLDYGGEVLRYSKGIIWVTPDVPFSQSMGDPDDDLIRRKILAVVYHFT